jgi:hypothetical protein
MDVIKYKKRPSYGYDLFGAEEKEITVIEEEDGRIIVDANGAYIEELMIFPDIKEYVLSLKGGG